MDGSLTLAAGWPYKLSFMSGTDVNLPIELLICWDTVASSIQKLLNTVNHSDESKLEVVEYIRNDIAHVTYPDEIEDNMPNMLAGSIYNKDVLRHYTAGEEDSSKFFFNFKTV